MKSTAVVHGGTAKRVARAKRPAVPAPELSANRGLDGSYSIAPDKAERRRADWEVPASDQRRKRDRDGGARAIKV
jgi:hypothetical protein